MKDSVFYKNHLRALELKRQEEEAEREAGKVLIMKFAEQMQYDDDFDEEELFSGSYTGKKRPQVVQDDAKALAKKKERIRELNSADQKQITSATKAPVTNEEPCNIDMKDAEPQDNMDVLAAFDAGMEEEDDEDDDIDALARFVEGQDTELQLGHTDSLNDDEDKNKRRREKQMEEARRGERIG